MVYYSNQNNKSDVYLETDGNKFPKKWYTVLLFEVAQITS